MFIDSKIKTILGSNIKTLRIKFSLTQEQLAEMIEVQAQTIAKIETGKLFMSSELLARFCNFFKVSPAILFTENLRIIQDENVNYLSRINSLLPSFDEAKLREIYNILLALKK